MRVRDFPGAFFLHPVFILAMGLTVLNNLWLKPSGWNPVIAGKLSDCAIMVFLPALISLLVVFVRYQVDSVRVALGSKVPPDCSLEPSHRVVLVAIAISAVVMTALQTSEAVSGLYDATLRAANDVLFFGRVPAKARPDVTDLVSLIFVAIPYRVLTRSHKEMNCAMDPACMRGRRFRS